MPKVSFRMASASREWVFGVQTNTARKIHRSDPTEGRLTTAPSGCCVRKGTVTGTRRASSTAAETPRAHGPVAIAFKASASDLSTSSHTASPEECDSPDGGSRINEVCRRWILECQAPRASGPGSRRLRIEGKLPAGTCICAGDDTVNDVDRGYRAG